MEIYPPTEKTQVKRRSQRGCYDRATVHAILDEGFLCHVGFVAGGHPVVIPTAYGRDGDRLFLHGAPLNRSLRSMAEGLDVCVTVTLVDALVLARSAFHHSINYRSVVIFGRATEVTDLEDKRHALRVFTDHVVRGRWDAVREPDEREIDGTLVVELPLEEVSAKIRTGPPIDDEADMTLPVWAGLLPLAMVPQAPVPDPQLAAGIALPDHVQEYTRLRG
jgi:nitroimidazol reductase NimA-like FMN-containing flavoprotein (pyridoxamine 5'-phosphate oxidase superfamily)